MVDEEVVEFCFSEEGKLGVAWNGKDLHEVKSVKGQAVALGVMPRDRIISVNGVAVPSGLKHKAHQQFITESAATRPTIIKFLREHIKTSPAPNPTLTAEELVEFYAKRDERKANKAHAELILQTYSVDQINSGLEKKYGAVPKPPPAAATNLDDSFFNSPLPSTSKSKSRWPKPKAQKRVKKKQTPKLEEQVTTQQAKYANEPSPSLVKTGYTWKEGEDGDVTKIHPFHGAVHDKVGYSLKEPIPSVLISKKLEEMARPETRKTYQMVSELQSTTKEGYAQAHHLDQCAVDHMLEADRIDDVHFGSSTILGEAAGLSGGASNLRVWPRVRRVLAADPMCGPERSGPETLARLRVECSNYALVAALLAAGTISGYMQPPLEGKHTSQRGGEDLARAYAFFTATTAFLQLLTVLLSTTIIILTNLCVEEHATDYLLAKVDDLTYPNTLMFFISLVLTPFTMVLGGVMLYDIGITIPIFFIGLISIVFVLHIFVKFAAKINTFTVDADKEIQAALVKLSSDSEQGTNGQHQNHSRRPGPSIMQARVRRPCY